MAEETAGQRPRRMTRRTFLTRAAAMAGALAGSGAVVGVPTIWAQQLKDITLRQVAGSYSAIIDIARQATKNLGFKIAMQNAASDAMVNRVATQLQSLDLADLEQWMLVKLLPRGVLQGVDLQRFRHWEAVVPIFTTGEYPDGRPVSRQGIAPHEVQYLEQPVGIIVAQGQTRWATMIPTLYNADTLGLRPDLVQRPIEHWYEGKPAHRAITDPYGHPLEPVGHVRDGGLAQGAHGQGRLLEHRDGRQPLHGAQMERVCGGLGPAFVVAACPGVPRSAWCVAGGEARGPHGACR